MNYLINILVGFRNLSQGKPWGFETDPSLITAIVKFNPAIASYYTDDRSQITLRFFEDEKATHFNQDQVVATQIIQQNLEWLSTLGKQPHWLFKSVYCLLTKIPYEAIQVEKYVGE